MTHTAHRALLGLHARLGLTPEHLRPLLQAWGVTPLPASPAGQIQALLDRDFTRGAVATALREIAGARGPHVAVRELTAHLHALRAQLHETGTARHALRAAQEADQPVQALVLRWEAGSETGLPVVTQVRVRTDDGEWTADEFGPLADSVPDLQAWLEAAEDGADGETVYDLSGTLDLQRAALACP